MGRSLILVGIVALSACIQSTSVTCGDGRICPADSICDEANDRCLVPEQLDACSMRVENADCQFRGIDGICVDGVCVPTSCGDHVVTGAEECDGEALGELDDCEDLGYYDQTPLTCGTDCRYDRTKCTTGLCGDKLRNGPEVCDGNDIEFTDCLELGYYESGALSCNDACNYNVTACHGFCGDMILNGPEVCEAQLPLLESCVSYGADRGYLACSKCLPNVSECRYNNWRKLPITVSTVIRSLHGTSGSDVFAAGSDGALLHYDGARWTPMTPAIFDHFTGVFAFATDHVIAVGQQGTIQRWNGTAWSQMVINDSTWQFSGVIGFGTNTAFAVGNNGLLRYDGTTWTSFAAPSATPLVKIWGRSPTDLYVINNVGAVSRYSGSTWTPVALPGAPAATAVWGAGTSEVYIHATDGLYHLVGTSWVKIPVTLGTINAGAPTSGDKYCVVGPVSAVWCFDGVLDYAQLTSTASGFGDLNAVWASASDDVFIAGTLGIQHFQGSIFFITYYMNTQNNPTPMDPTSFWSDGNVVYGAAGDMIRYTTASPHFATVFSATNGGALYGVGGTGPSDVFAVGQAGEIRRFNGATWSGRMTNTDPDTLYAVWGAAPNNIYAVGANGTILRFTNAWAAVTSSTNAELRDVWSSSPSDVFVVGKTGTILHSTGATFSPMASGTTRDLYGVYGFSPTDVYAVGDVGTLLHYDGTTWTAVPTGTGARLNDVWGTASDDVFVIGDLGFMLYNDGTRWTPVRRGVSNQLALGGVGNELFIGIPGTMGLNLLRLAPW